MRATAGARALVAAAASVAAVALVQGQAGPDAPASSSASASASRWKEPYSEWSRPAGRARGAVLVIHGGSWNWVGPEYAVGMRPDAERLRRLGYATLNIDYRRGRAGLKDVRRFYRRLDRRMGRRPVCVFGASAGGHLGLMLASKEPSVRCVIGAGAPTDLVTSRGIVRRAARRFFDDLPAWSPARRRIRARVLLAAARNDRIVPFGQAKAMDRRRPSTSIFAFGRPSRAAAKTEWIHSHVSSARLRAYYRRERAFLARAMR